MGLWIVEVYNQLVTFYEVCWLVGILGVKMKEDIVDCFFLPNNGHRVDLAASPPNGHHLT